MKNKSITGVILNDQFDLSLSDICRVCNCHAEWVEELVDEGVLDPVGYNQTQWRFSGSSLQKAHTAMRLERDLGLNLAGVALALDLIEELSELRIRLRRFQAENTE